ncbi:MAG: maleylpyruvate isomerase N-terminal domain-containing protein [Chloroflexi bacterium]|nr:maleylpyruvate isomerase N-terminal domain-containing protein [Chloroflexota bacterium]
MRIDVETPRTADLFAPMRAELLRVLRGLSDAEWNAPTACAEWSVRDVALHLFGDDVGLLSNLRDGDSPPGRFEAFDDLVAYINDRNATWIDASRRMSRRLLLSLLEFTGAQWVEYVLSVDPEEPAGPIGWTGNAQDSMGLHLAREFTEFWMHHQHICEAVGVVSMKDAPAMRAALGTFIHCLPRTYSAVDARVDTLVKVVITGEGGGTWHLVREADRWRLYADTDLRPAATVTLDTDTAWRLFTKGIDQGSLEARTHIDGDQALGRVFLTAVAILA